MGHHIQVHTGSPREVLKSFGLRFTATREEVLVMFQEKDRALSHADIEENLTLQTDRVTVYRTLRTFLDKGILHKVLDDSGQAKYALCKDACDHDHHNHEHVHFKCTSCGNTTCLDEVSVPKFILPEGYQAEEQNILVQGVCKNCSAA